jgi:hypothetical protein
MYKRALTCYEKALGRDLVLTVWVTQCLCSLYHRMAFEKRFKVNASRPRYDRYMGTGLEKSALQILSDCVRVCQQYSSSGSLIYGYLGRVLLWLHNEDLAIIAFEQQIELVDNKWQHLNIVCDGCKEQLTLQT